MDRSDDDDGRAERRSILRALFALGATSKLAPALGQSAPLNRDAKAFIERAFAMRDLAVRAGDQPYGAVIVKDGRLIAGSPSRVISRGDRTAHAEREALREAIAAIGAQAVRGATIYSSSLPCAMCQAALHKAGVARMIHGESLTDAGPPQAR